MLVIDKVVNISTADEDGYTFQLSEGRDRDPETRVKFVNVCHVVFRQNSVVDRQLKLH